VLDEFNGLNKIFLALIDAILLTKKGQEILKLLGAGNPASVVAKAVGCSRSNASYWKYKFVSIGAIAFRFATSCTSTASARAFSGLYLERKSPISDEMSLLLERLP